LSQLVNTFCMKQLPCESAHRWIGSTLRSQQCFRREMEWIWNGWRRKDHNDIEIRIKLRDKACWTAATTEDDDMFVHWFWWINRRSTVWKGRRERCQTRLLLFQQQREDMDDVSLAYPCLHATAMLVRFHVACSLVRRARSTSDLLNHEWRLCRKVELKSSTTDEVQSHELTRKISCTVRFDGCAASGHLWGSR
jgi:hypothetical protein